MSTLTKAKKPARKTSRRPGKTADAIPGLLPVRTPPKAKATAGDLLRSMKDGSWDAAAAKCDWDIVERAVKNRSSSPRILHAS